MVVVPSDSQGYGWLRIWSNGPGIAWKPSTAPLIFSERYGHSRSYVVGPWRVKYLPRFR